jgi:hypothetical protein
MSAGSTFLSTEDVIDFGTSAVTGLHKEFVYSERNTFWPVKFSSGRFGTNHFYDGTMFCRLPPESSVCTKKTGSNANFVAGGDNHK